MINLNTTIRNKSAWVRPAVRRIEAGSAESLRGGVADGSGQQAS